MNCHPGHRHYIGGSIDGHTTHLVHATPADYPTTIGTPIRDGQRSWYRIDPDASRGLEVVYRLVKHDPARPSPTPRSEP